MAYIDGDFLVNIKGTLANNEIWSNTWAMVGALTAVEKQDCVDALHTFYNDITPFLSAEWTADVATGTDLATGVSVDYAWGAFVGTETAKTIPTQLAIRCSLSNDFGVRGGPFLTGWTIDAIDATKGLIAPATVTQIAGELDQLGQEVLAAGASLGIHRPTLETVVIASMGRVGQRFDIIRKRANEVLEAYTPVAF